MNKTFNVQRSTFNVQFYSLGLIGYPLGHSLSPQIHNAALQALGLDGKYSLFPIPPTPAGQSELNNLLNQVRQGMIHGLNVTIPHKQNVIPLLDDLTPAAEAIGAVNTIYKARSDDFSHPTLVGDNTDAPGFWADVQRFARRAVSGEREAQSTSHTALVLGAGGSARAVIYALLLNGYVVSIAARRIEKAWEISKKYSVFSNQISIMNLDYLPLTTNHYSLIVNATPVGMHPHIDASPWPAGVSFPENAAVYDLVYNPRETLLVRQASAAGLPAITGLGMLVEQAALAIECWTGFEAQRDTMLKAAETNQ